LQRFAFDVLVKLKTAIDPDLDRLLVQRSIAEATRTVRLRDLNGNFEVVEVDTTKSDKVLTIQFQQTPAQKPE